MAFEKRKYLESLRVRFNELASRFGQAELSRRTGMPQANVHRYLREGKVPVEFCAALICEFQVSPIWLLEGRGGMLRSEVRKPIADMGGDLLELVETMNSVSRMRIGAVAGQRDLTTLRELSDSMDAFDSLREKLNLRSRPLLGAVLDELGEAVDRMDLDRAATLRLTAQQLARLTTDDMLLEKLDSHEGGFAYLSGNLENAIASERKVFARRMVDARIHNEDDLTRARNLAMALRDSGRLKEARRFVRASLALSEDDCRGSSVRHQMRMFEAHLDADLGDIRTGLDKAARAFAEIKDDYFFAGISYSYIQLLAGLWTVPEALPFGRMSGGKARMLTRFAAGIEDVEGLSACLPALIGSPPEGLPEHEYDTTLARLILDLLKGGKRRVEDYDELATKYPPRIASPHLRSVMVSLHRAQIARLCGDTRTLKQESTKCEQAWRDVPEELYVKVEWLLPHFRNLEAIPPRQRTKLQKEALARLQSEISNHAASGYGFLKTD
ncbi:MAG: hypothetical protein R3E76_01385 [Planctomycetota bacterium]